jgi:hypothetical protein
VVFFNDVQCFARGDVIFGCERLFPRIAEPIPIPLELVPQHADRLGQYRIRNVSTLHRILGNRIYTGDFDNAGKTYQGIHDPRVTATVWERVREALTWRHEKKHRKTTHDFASPG